MTVYQDVITVPTEAGKVTFCDIREDVERAVAASQIANGLVCIQTPHTTCSVIFEEFVHDTNWQGQEFLQGDLCALLDGLVPRELEEGRQYRYPGPKHIEFLGEYAQEHPGFPGESASILNGDAHLRASFFGSTQTFVVTDGSVTTGEFGHIYLVDWDQNRPRNRKAVICVLGE